MRAMSVASALVALAGLSAPVGAQWQDPTLLNIRNSEEHAQRAVAAYMDADNRVDVVVAYSLTDRIQIEFNEPAAIGGFVNVTIGSNIVGMFAVPGDFDADGDIDVAAVGLFDRNQGFNSNGVLRWYERNGDPRLPASWTEHTIADDIIHLRALRTADFDRNGRLDLVVISSGANPLATFPGIVRVYASAIGAEPFGLVNDVDTTVSNPQYLWIADIDNDQDMDVFSAETAGARIVWYENTGVLSVWNERTLATPVGARAVRAVDVDRDGRRDLIFSTLDDCAGTGSMAWLRQPAAPTVDTWIEQALAAAGASDLLWFDANNDGSPDLVSGYSAGNGGCVDLDGFVSFRERNGAGVITATHTYSYQTGAAYAVSGAEAADLDNDGDRDLITASYGGHSVDQWRNQHPADWIFVQGFQEPGD